MAPRPDLILLDVMMPEMDGHTVLGHLRNNPNTRDIPVIFVTALSDESNEELGFELGAVDYITKPIKSAIVLARVRAHLELKQARDQLKDQNAWLEAEVARRMRDNLLIQDVSLCALAELAETRDTDTGNHIRRTQSFVEVLARQLQRDSRHAEELSETRLSLIVKATPLHDIGKIGIPDRILLKPGRLTPEEFEIMKTHSRIGAEAIGKAMEKAAAINHQSADHHCTDALAFLDTARVIALSHHERWDGAGYPEGLAGTAIPLPARLMAVADVFDALASRRVYKPPMNVAEVAKYIHEQSGAQFDPDVVDAFLASQEEFSRISQRFSDEAAAI
jgi:putative two-component system response regulator